MVVEAELKRSDGAVLQPWLLTPDTESPTSFADPTMEPALRDRVGAKTDVETLGNGSVIALLKRLRTVLGDIFTAVDGLEVSVGDVDLNTDQLEAKLDTLHTDLVAVFGAVDGVEALLGTLATQATLASILTAVDNVETLIAATQPRDVVDRAARLLGHVDIDNFPATQPVSATDLDTRALSLAQDNVRQTLRPMLPVSVTKTGPLTDDVLVAVAPGSRLRLIRNAGHADPAISAGTYPVVTLKIGAMTFYSDKLEGGLPWGETVCFEGADGEDLTLDLTGASSVFLNLRYELFAA